MEVPSLLHLHSAGVYKALQNTMLTKQKSGQFHLTDHSFRPFSWRYLQGASSLAMQSPGRHWSRHRSSLPWQKWLLESFPCITSPNVHMSTCKKYYMVQTLQYLYDIYINDRYSSLFMHTIQYAWIHCTYKTLSCIHVNDSWPPWSPGLPIFQGTTSSGDKSISGCSVGSESSKSGPQMCDIVPASSSVSDASFCWNRLSHWGSNIIEWHWTEAQHSFATARGMPFIPRLWQELCRHVLILDICRLSTTHCSSPETNEWTKGCLVPDGFLGSKTVMNFKDCWVFLTWSGAKMNGGNSTNQAIALETPFTIPVYTKGALSVGHMVRSRRLHRDLWKIVVEALSLSGWFFRKVSFKQSKELVCIMRQLERFFRKLKAVIPCDTTKCIKMATGHSSIISFYLERWRKSHGKLANFGSPFPPAICTFQLCAVMVEE